MAKLGNSIIEEDSGRVMLSPADTVPTVMGKMGTDIVAPMRAPEPAKGQFAIPSLTIDPNAGAEMFQAQARIGAAVSKFGDVIGDIAIRETVFRQEQDRVDKQKRDSQLQADFYDTVYNAELMRREGKEPQEIEQYFNSRWQAARENAEGHEYNFIQPNVIQQELDNKFKGYRLEFYNKVLEPSYMTHAKRQYLGVHDNVLDSVAKGGALLDIEPLIKGLGIYGQMLADPASALYGLNDNVYTMQEKAIFTWLNAAIQENPTKAKDLIPQIEQFIPPQFLADFKEKTTRAFDVATEKATTQGNKLITQQKNMWEDRIAEGSATTKEIWEDSVLPAREKEALVEKQYQQDNRRRERRENINRWEQYAADGSKYGQKLTEKENKQLEDHHEEFVDTVLNQLPVEKRTTALISHYAPGGHLPESVISRVRAGLNSNDEQQFASGAQIAQSLRNAKPELYYKYFEDYDHIVGMVDYGYSIEEIKKVRTRSISDGDYKKMADDYIKENDTMFDSDIDKIYDEKPTNIGAAKAAHEQLFRNNLKLVGGDAELARDLTRKQLPRRYGMTMVNGNGVMMEYPPEAVYGDPYNMNNNEWIREQMNWDMQKQGVPKLKDGEFFIQIDDPRAEKKTYSILRVDKETGHIFPIARGWYPDRQAYQEYKKANPGWWERTKRMVFGPDKTAREIIDEKNAEREQINQSLKRHQNAKRR